MGFTDGVPLWDHHCHALVGQEHRADLRILARCLSEAPPHYPLEDLFNTVPYQEALGIIAERLGAAVTDSAVEAALRRTEYETYSAALFREAHYEALLVDTGYAPPSGSLPPAAMQRQLGIPIYPVLRLETMAQTLMTGGLHFDDWISAVRYQVTHARQDGYVGVKSIIAYRSGLAVAPVRHQDARQAFDQMQQAGCVRLESAVLLNYLLWEVTPLLIQEHLPLQIHTGFGDPDIDLTQGTPLLLRTYLEQFQPAGHLVTLLHTYPYHREAGFLASVYPGVYVDVSLALPLAASGARRILLEALELAPMSRVLFASDSHSRPESFFLAARLWRDGLEAFLETAVREHRVRAAVAEDWAWRVLSRTCQEVYELSHGA